MPWLFNRPIRSRLKIYDNSYRQPLYIGSDVSIYSAYQKGILFGMQEKHEDLNMGMTLGVEFKGITPADIPDITVSIDYNPELLHKKFAFVFLELSLMWSYVDNILNPKNGWNAFVSCLAMGDIADQTSLFKMVGEYALYVPFTPQTVFAVRTRVGHVFNREYRDIMPIDRFYLGGAGFGFRYNTPIGPLRFDLAFKLDRKYPEFESPYAWYLTLGQAF